MIKNKIDINLYPEFYKPDNRMAEYQQGMIYQIISDMTDRIYIGSTTNLKQRWNSHRYTYKSKTDTYSSFILFDLVGVENCRIETIHLFPCHSKQELEREEGDIQLMFKDIIVNKIIAGRTSNERYSREYYLQNRDKQKEYYFKNRDKIKEYNRNYNLDNVDKIRENYKEYYVNNCEKIRAQHNEKYTCKCGAKLAVGNKSRHEKNEKHKKRIDLSNALVINKTLLCVYKMEAQF